MKNEFMKDSDARMWQGFFFKNKNEDRGPFDSMWLIK